MFIANIFVFILQVEKWYSVEKWQRYIDLKLEHIAKIEIEVATL